jgi:hypothetical protein
MDIASQRHELETLRARVHQLEAEIAAAEAAQGGPVVREYPAYFATTGFLLGIFGALASLLFNIIGSLVAGKSPLELIRVYLTFPLGAKALLLADRAQNVYAVGDGLILALGCCLYLLTGMLLGIPVSLALTRLSPRGSTLQRFVVAGGVALAIWLINFYGILAWLQPLLLGGRWITDTRLLPWWVAAATHLVFGWTIVLVYPLGQYTPYRRPAANA